MRNGSAASSKTGLFLMEIIIMLLFFTLCAAVCMRMFAAAQVNSDYSRDLSEASLRAQSVAECYKAAEGDLGATAELLGLGQDALAGETLTIYYDPAWEPGESREEAAYTLTADLEKGAQTAEISVVKSGEEEALFAIEVKAVRLYGN